MKLTNSFKQTLQRRPKVGTAGNRLAFAVTAIIGINAAFSFAEEGAGQIMQKSMDAMTLAGSESISTLTINDGKGNQRVRKFSSAQKTDASKKVTKNVMRFLEPADVKGTGILTFDYEDKDDDMWLYMPALRKIRRIVSSEKTKNFMGSEFTNSDITKPSIAEYTYKMLGTESIGDVECWKIEVLPATKEIGAEYGYSKKVSWIGKADYTARKNEFYDLEGKLLKVMMTEKIKLLDEKNKKYLPVDITMDNKQNGRSSRIIMEKVVFNPNVKEEYFTTDYLEK
jgi:outer membrane lipoprotein-sorting protein